jgi:hypothetical protein
MHVAAFAVEGPRRNWTQSLWTACTEYARYRRGGTDLYAECIEHGARVIRDADITATRRVRARCSRAALHASGRSLLNVAEAIFGHEGSYVDEDSVSRMRDGASAQSFDRKSDYESYSKTIENAKERTDELLQRFKAMPEEEFVAYRNAHRAHHGMGVVTHEWCLSYVESDLTHQMQYDVMYPLIFACRSLNARKALDACALAGGISLESANASVHAMQNRCLKTGAAGIYAVASEFREVQTRKCTDAVEKAVVGSLLDVQSALSNFSKNSGKPDTERLYEELLGVINVAKDQRPDCDVQGQQRVALTRKLGVTHAHAGSIPKVAFVATFGFVLTASLVGVAVILVLHFMYGRRAVEGLLLKSMLHRTMPFQSNPGRPNDGAYSQVSSELK